MDNLSLGTNSNVAGTLSRKPFGPYSTAKPPSRSVRMFPPARAAASEHGDVVAAREKREAVGEPGDSAPHDPA